MRFNIVISMLTVMIFFTSGCGGKGKPASAAKDSSAAVPGREKIIRGDTISTSPGKDFILLTKETGAGTNVWIIKSSSSSGKNLLLLRSGQKIGTAAWNPPGGLAAFEIYNSEGHSPLTTAHVWVVRYDGSGLREVLLPSPDERFSTSNPRWTKGGQLEVTGASLTGNNDKYLFNYADGTIKKEKSR